MDYTKVQAIAKQTIKELKYRAPQPQKGVVMKHVIHIFGASGSGTSTLGRNAEQSQARCVANASRMQIARIGRRT